MQSEQVSEKIFLLRDINDSNVPAHLQQVNPNNSLYKVFKAKKVLSLNISSRITSNLNIYDFASLLTFRPDASPENTHQVFTDWLEENTWARNYPCILQFSTRRLIAAKHHYAVSFTENKRTIVHFSRLIVNDDDVTSCFEMRTAKYRSGTATPA